MSERNYVLTSAGSNTGMNRYATLTANAVSSELVSLREDLTKSESHYTGKVFSGAFPPLLGSGWYPNHFLPHLFQKKAWRFLRRNITTESVVHYSSQDIVPFNLKSIKLVTVHDLFGLDKRFNPKSALRYALGKTMKKFAQFENVIAISNKVKKELVDFGFKGEITVIHNAVAPVFHKLKIDRFKIREELNLPTDKKLVLSVSSMEARKNLGAVKDTMDLLGDEYALVRVGGEIDSCTSFSGVDDFTLNKIYNACDVLLNPTLDEGFGAPVAEAMSTGLPVVASDIEILREIAGSSAVLVEPQPLKLTYAVKDAINNSEEYGKKGIERASRFSLEKFNENLSKLYSGISGIDTKLK